MNTPREEKQIFHFLLPDSGMANYSDKTVKQRYPDDFKALDSWRKEFTKALHRMRLPMCSASAAKWKRSGTRFVSS